MQKQKRKTNHIHRAACALLAGLALSLGLLTGCGSDGSTIVVGKKNEKGYSRAEVMVIAMTEKKRYEEVCTDQIWGVSVGEKGDDFETYLKKQIRSFMDELKIMNLLAADRGISLTSEERAAMDRAAAEYFGRLPQSAIDSMGVTESDVQHIYEDYGLAEKLAGQLTDNVALEVIAARHLGMRVLGVSCLSNKNLPDCMVPAPLAEIIAVAGRAGENLARLLRALVTKL